MYKSYPVFAVLLSLACEDNPNLTAASGELAVDARRVDFGEQYIGSQVSFELSVRNGGSTEVQAQVALEGSGQASYFVPSRVTVPPRGEAAVAVIFQPADLGELVVTLNLIYERQSLGVTLSGDGKPTPNCDDGNPCTDNWFDLGTGNCAQNNRQGLCSDDDACTQGDRCLDGLCLGHRINCVEEFACTEATCDPQQGCVLIPHHDRCDDGDPCTQNLCDAEQGCTFLPLSDGVACGPFSCQEMAVCIAGQCLTGAAPDGYPCDDGNVCTRGDSCLAGSCEPGEGSGFGLAQTVVRQAPAPLGGERLSRVLAVSEGPDRSVAVVYHFAPVPAGSCADDCECCCSNVVGGQVYVTLFDTAGQVLWTSLLATASVARATIDADHVYLAAVEAHTECDEDAITVRKISLGQTEQTLLATLPPPPQADLSELDIAVDGAQVAVALLLRDHGATCFAEGSSYNIGDRFLLGCRECSCQADGSVVCSHGCGHACEVNGRYYLAGDTFLDGCSTCTCEADGSASCDDDCSYTCEYEGSYYLAGDCYPVGDGCNLCRCDETGQSICTFYSCEANPVRTCPQESNIRFLAHVTQLNSQLQVQGQSTQLLARHPMASSSIFQIHDLQLRYRDNQLDLGYLAKQTGDSCSNSLCQDLCTHWCPPTEARVLYNITAGPVQYMTLASSARQVSLIEDDPGIGVVVSHGLQGGAGCCLSPYEAARLHSPSPLGPNNTASTLVEHNTGYAVAGISAFATRTGKGLLVLEWNGQLGALLQSPQIYSTYDLSLADDEHYWNPHAAVVTSASAGYTLYAGLVGRTRTPCHLDPGGCLLGMGSLGCGEQPATTPLEFSYDRFTGKWLVDQPYHAGYEATVYQFNGDGSLRIESSVIYNNTYQTGSTYHPGTGVSCLFGDRWSSPNSGTLIVSGDCSDGVARDIQIGFRADPANDHTDAAGFVALVGGQPGWSHSQFMWRWSKCPTGVDTSECSF